MGKSAQIAANPTGNVGAAKAEAKKRGYAVVD